MIIINRINMVSCFIGMALFLLDRNTGYYFFTKNFSLTHFIPIFSYSKTTDLNHSINWTHYSYLSRHKSIEILFIVSSHKIQII